MRTVSAQNKTRKSADARSYAGAVAPSTTATPMNQNQEPSTSLDGINCRSITPASIIDISGTTAKAAIKANPPPPNSLTLLKSDCKVFTNSGHTGQRSVKIITSEKYRLVKKN